VGRWIDEEKDEQRQKPCKIDIIS